MNRLIESLHQSYYLTLVMAITASLGIIISTKLRRKRSPLLRYFPIYFLLSLTQTIISEIYSVSNTVINGNVVHASINIFICVEFFVIINFFYRLRLSPVIQKIILFVSVTFYTFLLGMWIIKGNFFETPNELYIAEALFAIPLSLTYFYYLFKDPPIRELDHDPTFWISTGILFYFTTTLPFFLVQTKIDWKVYILLYPLNYLAYAILFALIIRAYLCKPEILK